MPVIVFRDGQGLGNQLWLYASAKSICEKLGFELEIKDYSKFKGKDFLNLDFDNNTDIGYKGMCIFNERLYYDKDLRYIVSSFDENILKIKENTILEGIFQSEKYFFNDLKKISRYIKIDKKLKDKYLIDKEFCILNIRGGEYKRHRNFMLNKNYWLNAMNNFKNKFKIYNFKIVTDDFLYAKSLFPKLEIIHNDIAACYATIYNCSNIIVSNSSFSYFPCRTGIKKNIIAPMYWARPNKNFGRWISPGNIYEGWLYQDKLSNLKSQKECIQIAENTSLFYKNNFNILIQKKDVPSTGFLNFLPAHFKKNIKSILKHIFPRFIG